MDRERADGQLAQIAETVGLARRLGARVWLRGGWAMDFFLGARTRDHEDIDWFAPAADAAALAAGLGALGYAPLEGAPPEQQLDFVKDGLESSFALVDLAPDGRVLAAGGPWAGRPGRPGCWTVRRGGSTDSSARWSPPRRRSRSSG